MVKKRTKATTRKTSRAINRRLEDRLQTAFNRLREVVTIDACKHLHRRDPYPEVIRCSDELDLVIDRVEDKVRRRLGLPRRERF